MLTALATASGPVQWDNNAWDIGYLVGVWLVPLLGLVIVGLIAGAVVYMVTENEKATILVGGIVGTIALVGGFVAVSWPFDSSFHKVYQVSGKVDQVGNRLITSGSGDSASVSQRYVLVIDGQPFGVDDTRASLVKVGDSVDLVCHRDYQFRATSGWVCDWGKIDG